MINLPLELVEQILKYLSIEDVVICYRADPLFHVLTDSYILKNIPGNLSKKNIKYYKGIICKTRNGQYTYELLLKQIEHFNSKLRIFMKAANNNVDIPVVTCVHCHLIDVHNDNSDFIVDLCQICDNVICNNCNEGCYPDCCNLAICYTCFEKNHYFCDKCEFIFCDEDYGYDANSAPHNTYYTNELRNHLETCKSSLYDSF